MTQKFKYMMLAGLMITSVSCKKALDINTDPYRPSAGPVNKLLPQAERNLADAFAISSGISQVLEVYTHRMVVREDPDQYGATGDDFNLQANWDDVYVSTLPILDAIISQGTKDGNLHYVGIAEVLKAYAASQMVDIYGDVPFSQADKTGITSPVFDKGATAYAGISALLDKGITDLGAAAGPLEPGTDDLIYGGMAKGSASTPKWILAANSLKLKLLVQQRLVPGSTAAADAAALIAGGKLIAATTDDFVIPFGPNAAFDDRSPAFNDYLASQRGNYISPWFYEIMNGVNPNILKNNLDPRMPYYFFKQSSAATLSANPIEYRDVNGFTSIYFGSLGPNAAQIQQNFMTVLGIYPAGGRYDDAKGQVVSATSGTGAAPYRLITYADVLFMEAELQQVAADGSATATLQAAITESFKQVDYVVTTYVKPTQTVPTLASKATAVTAYITKAMAEYTTPAVATAGDGSYDASVGVTTSAGRRLEIIMTQKWLSSFGTATEAYTDYRRTGFPLMFDPKNATMAPGGKVQPPTGGNAGASSNDPEAAVLVTRSKDYPQTLPWASDELTRNSSAPKQKVDPSIVKPFWKP